MQIADISEEIDHELISKDQIEHKIAEVARQVSDDYRGGDLLLVGVLKGAVNTMVNVAMNLSIPADMDFMSLSSYGSGTVSTGTVSIRQDLTTDVKGRRVLIVEDIVDSGHTLDWLVKELEGRGAASVDVFVLLEKPARREVAVDVRYKGFEIPDEFVVGFGLDYDERFRNLDSIAVLRPEVYQGEEA
ncbi:hypoxanthine phosphoribosyltransferase [Bifidobacterium aemilianum]|uniref:Hypoxanthine phosphoribosyltransferase n=1 Tax=Bifidobacterium aemilianum TaxID=2493120 RepID=A0A366K6S3_9BIFI|nr:hypoxanthine phosphoribosyltransferase [Bifidobacterium aemilianum]RBP97379.1 hypoxanthine phosphoribosyltransferase [Bifidobacterium aemilianum]